MCLVISEAKIFSYLCPPLNTHYKAPQRHCAHHETLIISHSGHFGLWQQHRSTVAMKSYQNMQCFILNKNALWYTCIWQINVSAKTEVMFNISFIRRATIKPMTKLNHLHMVVFFIIKTTLMDVVNKDLKCAFTIVAVVALKWISKIIQTSLPLELMFCALQVHQSNVICLESKLY